MFLHWQHVSVVFYSYEETKYITLCITDTKLSIKLLAYTTLTLKLDCTNSGTDSETVVHKFSNTA